MKKLTIILCLIFSVSLYSQQKFEQKAFDYFLNSIANTDFPNLGKIKFSGTAEFATSGSLFGIDCLKKDENLFVRENGFKTQEDLVEIENKSKINLSKKPLKKRSDKINLMIYQVLKITDKNIVTLKVTHNGTGTFYYLVINRNYEIIEWCKSNFII